MIRPFIKWPGGKSRVLPDLLPLLPKGDCLIEPFVGGASVFLNTDYSHYVLADINADLINLYQSAKNETEDLIRFSLGLFCHSNSKSDYLSIRKAFNEREERVGFPSAAIFLYLNRHGYNGMCRYNRKGDFNIPFGKYRAPYFPEQEIRQFAEKANDTGAIFVCADFKETLHVYAKPDTVTYCDPPYLPVSDTANFTQYHTSAFTPDQHRELADELLHVNRETGAPVVISNSDTSATREIYQHYQFHEIAVQRSISANGITRGAAKEVIGVLKTCDGCGEESDSDVLTGYWESEENPIPL
ncbi:Dam family site-specific DNA-(adenine-N6)-methyltransferase [Pectobacterium carotovorum subsp. carotovorum]|uniref:Dam family site-specific DNA-(adenine-N6)-methyltransferase n=1 Tax=Pectobacterium carotovorum TaxID=554 RepID=UPI0016015911|nr:Dam family site-specific DNA-(adenine-N6)-methyltransferase [Pectobacterium carotovorum]MBB1525665.1 Dam family site-specific DNA-(adenine-N6)-methyltransferase [Pectobacterium carotovorum subsp. carotovorum]MCA6964745.1 Dam family site-specific DNA-(adenine-N6)-methyltransferase [Pectobacterium carotovorum]MCH4987175.1 Dam family site-specific DNA-(adenine-N6)-methyltransferase [Pectobacterium carotovorum]